MYSLQLVLTTTRTHYYLYPLLLVLTGAFYTGPDNAKLVAWDQNLRFLPVEVHVKAGMSLLVRAEHDEQQVRLGVPQIM